MRPRPALLALAVFCAGFAVPAASHAAISVSNGDSYVQIDDQTVEIGNGLFRQGWTFGTASSWVEDDRRASLYSAGPAVFNGVSSGALIRATATSVANGVEASLTFTGPFPRTTLLRTYRVLSGVSGLRIGTVLSVEAPVALTSYTLASVLDPRVIRQPSATATSFNGGSDWHSAIYDHRTDTQATAFNANGEWMQRDDAAIGLLLERRNYLSSRMSWIGNTVSTGVDLSYDGLYLGPINPYVVPNPTPAPLRARIVPASLELEPVIVALGSSADDLHWNAWKLLQSDIRSYPNTVNFNDNRINTPGVAQGNPPHGVNQAIFDETLPIAKSLGVETFVLDDGWAPYNGDWTPNATRWPNGLGVVSDALHANGMDLGLWMAPQSFRPDSTTWNAHPLWTCVPTGAATAAANKAGSGESYDAGIGIFDFNGIDQTGAFIDHLHSDIKRLTGTLGVKEFKFDYVVWTDCANGNVYANHDAFMSMLDALGNDEQGTGYGMDETNDFRAFPYESILRGPAWFQNGNPPANAVLHNVWSMASLVPGFAIGQAVTLRANDSIAHIDETMAAALSYHMTFWTDLREIEASDQQYLRDRVRLWTDFFKAHRSLNGFSYPLLNDPLPRTDWSGLQPWDNASDSGYAMLYRLDSTDSTQTVSFHAVNPVVTYRVTDITPTGASAVLGDFRGTTLAHGIPVSIPSANGVRILQINPLP